MVDLFNVFHQSGSFVKALNSTFLVMIPKKEGAHNVRDFRSINLVGCIHKFLSKVLAKQLSAILGQIISCCQHAFVGGRQITVAILIANEVVDDIINNKRDDVICKLDMEKAFDNVCWNFLDYLLNRMGFGWKWRKWIRSCILTSSFAVIVNGGPSSFFKASRGAKAR